MRKTCGGRKGSSRSQCSAASRLTIIQSCPSALDPPQCRRPWRSRQKVSDYTVVLVYVAPDGHDQLFDIAKDTAPEPLLSEITEEALHHVQPRATGWREVQMESRVTGDPLLHLGVLVGSVVVRDQVDVLSTGVDTSTAEYGLPSAVCTRSPRPSAGPRLANSTWSSVRWMIPDSSERRRTRSMLVRWQGPSALQAR